MGEQWLLMDEEMEEAEEALEKECAPCQPCNITYDAAIAQAQLRKVVETGEQYLVTEDIYEDEPRYAYKGYVVIPKEGWQALRREAGLDE